MSLKTDFGRVQSVEQSCRLCCNRVRLASVGDHVQVVKAAEGFELVNKVELELLVKFFYEGAVEA